MYGVGMVKSITSTENKQYCYFTGENFAWPNHIGKIGMGNKSSLSFASNIQWISAN